MDPTAYVPLHLEHRYLLTHPGLTDAAKALVHDQIAQDPERYATDAKSRALVSYMRAHSALMDELLRMEDLPDGDFERDRAELFERMRSQLASILQIDPDCVDARLVSIQLADVPLDACLGDMLQLERATRERLIATRPGFDPDAEGLWNANASAIEGNPPFGDENPPVDGGAFADRTTYDPEIIGWLHTIEALAQGCIFTARYRAAAEYARTAMRATGYPGIPIGTLFLSLARLEDEDGFFTAAREAGEAAEDLPWFLLGRAILLYKLGQDRSARRALREFCTRCEGGAFFLLNPTYHDPYLPTRPAAREEWDLAHQAVWEADGIIADTPGFTAWAEGIEGVRELSEAFAQRHGF